MPEHGYSPTTHAAEWKAERRLPSTLTWLPPWKTKDSEFEDPGIKLPPTLLSLPTVLYL